MYAVIESGGKQHRVEPGETVRLEKLDVAEGESITFDRVMLIGDGADIAIGEPIVEGSAVTGEIIAHGQGKKVTIIKMRRRKHYRRQGSHRQLYTDVKITDISRG